MSDPVAHAGAKAIAAAKDELEAAGFVARGILIVISVEDVPGDREGVFGFGFGKVTTRVIDRGVELVNNPATNRALRRE